MSISKIFVENFCSTHILKWNWINSFNNTIPRIGFHFPNSLEEFFCVFTFMQVFFHRKYILLDLLSFKSDLWNHLKSLHFLLHVILYKSDLKFNTLSQNIRKQFLLFVQFCQFIVVVDFCFSTLQRQFKNTFIWCLTKYFMTS